MHILVLALLSLSLSVAYANDRNRALRYVLKATIEFDKDLKQGKRNAKHLYKKTFNKEQRKWLGTSLSILKIVDTQSMTYTWEF